MDSGKTSGAEKGTTMVYWLGRVLRDARELEGVSRRQMDHRYGVHEKTQVRLEGGQYWPEKIEEIVGAYAKMAYGPDGDVRLLWQAAIDRWMEEGMPPGYVEPDDIIASLDQERLTVSELEAQRVRGSDPPQFD